MAGYTRQSSFTNGSVIDATDFESEFNALESAFNGSTGHTHDGTAGNGPPIESIGPSNDLVITAAVTRPKTNNVMDLGTSAIQFKNGFFDGTLRTDILTVDETSTFTGLVTAEGNVQIDGNLTVDGDTTISGNLTFGDNSLDSVTFGADINSNIVPNTDDFYDLGNPTKQWKDLYIDGIANIDNLVADSADINGGTIDGTVIGATAAAAITGTTLTAEAEFVGDLKGDIKAANGTVVFSAGTDGTDASVNINSIDSAFLTLNADHTGTPTADVGITVERGSFADRSFFWDESEDEWSTNASPLAVGAMYASSYKTSGSDGVVSVYGDTLEIRSSGFEPLDPLYKLDIDVVSGGVTFDSSGTDATSMTMRSGTFTVDATGDITLDADGGDIFFKDGGTTRGSIGAATANTLLFRAGSGEEMRLTTGGLGIANGLYVGSSTGTPTDNDIYAQGDITAAAGKFARDSNDYMLFTNNTRCDFYINGLNEFRMESDGDFHADGNIIAYSTTTSSDENLKENIQVVDNAVDKVNALRGVTFDWKRDGKSSAGVIAQDVLEVLPEAVTKVTGLKNNEEHLTVNYAALTSILVEAIKELKQEIEELKG